MDERLTPLQRQTGRWANLGVYSDSTAALLKRKTLKTPPGVIHGWRPTLVVTQPAIGRPAIRPSGRNGRMRPMGAGSKRSARDQAPRPWSKRLLRAVGVGFFEAVALVIVIFVVAFAITEIGTTVVSRPGAPAAVILPDLWPIVGWLAPLVFAVAFLMALLKG